MSEPGSASEGTAPRRFSWSVRSRILVTILSIAALGMAAAGATAYFVQRNYVLADVDARLSAATDSVRQVVAEGAGEDAQGDPTEFEDASAALRAAIARVLPDRNESTVGIVDGNVRWLPGSVQSFRIDDDPAFIERVLAESAGGDIVRGTAVTELGTLRYVAVPIEKVDSAQRAVFLAAYHLDREMEEVATSLRAFAIASVIALIATGVVGWVVSGRLLLPVRRLRETASRITASDLGERIPVTGSDDVSGLTATVNEMLDRLESASAAQRRLLADARHELLTPITIVRGHLELLDRRDGSEFEASRAIAIAELDRMARLVDDIEDLAIAESGAPLTLQQIDVADFTEQVFARASTLSDHEWVLGERAHSVAALDEDRITQAWLQLAANAARYSESPKPITIASAVRRGELWLSVADEGPGIPEEARARIFERLGRVNTARGAAGSGLGLAIVSSIAASHGGRVDLETAPTGSTFSIVLPHQEGAAP